MGEANKLINVSIFENSGDVKDCIKGLKELQELIHSKKNRSAMFMDIRTTFSEFLFTTTISSNWFFGGKKEYFKYVSTDISLDVLISKIMAQANPSLKSFDQILSIVLEYLNSLKGDVVESGELITEETAKAILNLPTVKSILPIISSPFPILILNVDYTSQSNSYAFPYLGIIINSRFNPANGKRSASDYIFMHELGHLLNHHFAPGCSGVPDSFGDVIENAFRNDIRIIPKKNLIEIFADCFSIACAYGTEYEKTNPFYKKFGYDDCKYITDYFQNLINGELVKLK